MVGVFGGDLCGGVVCVLERRKHLYAPPPPHPLPPPPSWFSRCGERRFCVVAMLWFVTGCGQRSAREMRVH